MATLATTKLTITSDAEKKTSRCVVTSKVGFTAFELNDMKNGLRFETRLHLVGRRFRIERRR